MPRFEVVRADHIIIRKLLNMIGDGRVHHVRAEYDRIADVFSKAGGSWERLFKGNHEDTLLLKRVVKIAIKKGYVTKKAK